MAADSEQWPRWPLWSPLVAAVFGSATAILVMGVVAAVLRSAGVDVGDKSPGFTAGTTFVTDLSVVAASILIASMTARPRPAQFGLRPAPLRYAAGIAFIGLVAFYLSSLLYSAIVRPDNPQRIVDDLGADRSTLMLVIGALLVIVVAPACEEIFFRGFLFRVLRSRLPFWLAAAADGVLFGLVHGVNVVLPILIILGVVLCWVYERTGTILPTMAIHAFNNVLAYGSSTDHGWPVAVPIGVGMLTACAVLATLLPRRGAPAAA